jgi:hypothetical protein
MPVPKELEVKNAIIHLLNGCDYLLTGVLKSGAGLFSADDLKEAKVWFKSAEAIVQKWIDEESASTKGGG